jgi:hypothetical protein
LNRQKSAEASAICVCDHHQKIVNSIAISEVGDKLKQTNQWRDGMMTALGP